MIKVWVLALLLLAGGALYTAPAEAATARGPILKGLFQKKHKSFKHGRKHKKYYPIAAKKHRKARWNRHTMVP